MKKIAFLSFDWDYEIMSAYYRSMEAYLASRDDMQLVIFNAFGQYANFEPEEGALEVFSLCNIGDYDGFVIQGNRTWSPILRQAVVDDIVARNKPVLSINYELNGACTVGTDNNEAMYGLVDRVLTDHPCRVVAFVNGLATSSEATARAHGFHKACMAHGIKDERFYQADWQMEEGVRVAQTMLERPDDLPDVIFCCNDELAVGVQETLLAHGVRIPEDVMVTGFDNREISLRATPRITTVDRDYATIGHTAITTLVGLMEGDSFARFKPSPARYVLAESCGYHDEDEPKELVTESFYAMDNALRRFYHVLSRFQPAVLNAETLSEILHECERRIGEMRCRNVYLNINENYLDDGAARATTTYGPTSLLMAHGGEDIGLVYDYKHVYTRFITKQLIPLHVPMDQKVYMVYPLRQGTTCIGTLVTEGVSPIQQYGFLTIILSLLSSSIENMRKKEILRMVNSRLDDLYVHDQLTGLFNRFGLNRFGSIAYEHMLRDFDEAQIIFVDIDNMKDINDTCGQEVGDHAIQDAAGIIRRATRDENAIAMRYGGDEFLLISRRNLTRKIERELKILKENTVRPYDLSLSIGVLQVFGSDCCSVKEAIDRASERMYEIKRARKAGR